MARVKSEPKRALSRRQFLHGTSALVASCAAAPAVIVDPTSADTLRFAIVGLNQRGAELRRALSLVGDSHVTVVCDVDERLLARETNVLDGQGRRAVAERDLRRVFERSDVDAVLIATPNHWHALAAIWALQAGKHVYVEKPVSHSIWEGEQLARAALRYGRIAQAGTQNRSDSGLRGFAAWKAQNDLGAVRWVHAVWYRVRAPIGKVAAPVPVPPEVDHDLFCGPREVLPVLRAQYHYDWHWQWPFGNGEIGNLGAHLVDDVRWVLGLGLPKRVLCAGARLQWNDDGETPNVSLSVLDYGAFPVVLDLRNFPLVPGGTVGPGLRGRGSGMLVRYERGWFFGSRAESTVYGEDGSVLGSWRGDAGKEHLQNFAQAIRRRGPAHRRAPLEDSVTSAATCHLANLAWRVGREATLDEVRTQIESIDPAHAVIDSLPAHLGAHGIDFAKTKLRLGGWLRVAADRARFESGDGVELANSMLREDCRAPFTVPEIA
jgi:predicted dehydrogenase